MFFMTGWPLEVRSDSILCTRLRLATFWAFCNSDREAEDKHECCDRRAVCTGQVAESYRLATKPQCGELTQLKQCAAGLALPRATHSARSPRRGLSRLHSTCGSSPFSACCCHSDQGRESCHQCSCARSRKRNMINGQPHDTTSGASITACAHAKKQKNTA